MFPLRCLTCGETTVEVMKIMATSFKWSQANIATLSAPDLQLDTTDPRHCQRLLDTHGWVWVSVLWGHCSFLLGPSAHKVLFVPSMSLFPQSCVSSGGSMVGLMVISSRGAYAIPRSALPRGPAPTAGHCWPIPPQEILKHTKAGLTQCLWGLLVCTRFSLNPLSICGGYVICLQMWFRPSYNLAGASTLPLDVGCLFGGIHQKKVIQHFPVEGCSAESCKFGFFTEDERMSFYSTILKLWDLSRVIFTLEVKSLYSLIEFIPLGICWMCKYSGIYLFIYLLQ